MKANTPSDMDTAAESANIAILVVSCDRYSDLWEPFFHCFWKYWPDCPYRIYLGSNFAGFDDPRVRVLKIGEDRSYGENLATMLQQIQEKWVIFWVEDRFISGRVDTAVVKELVRIAQARGAGYLKLIPEHPMGYDAEYGLAGEIPPRTHYRVSLTVALWRKDVFQQLLRPGETAWQIEKEGGARSDKMRCLFLGLAPRLRTAPPIPHQHLVVKGRLTLGSRRFLRKEGLTATLQARVSESLPSWLYALGFHLFFGAVWPMQHRSRRRSVPQT